MTNPHDKAIEAAAKAVDPDLFGDDPVVANRAASPFTVEAARKPVIDALTRAIAAYERELWVPVSECPEEWKDGRPLLAERAFDGNYKTDLPTYFEVRWRTDGFNFMGFMDFEGRRINVTRLRPLPKPEGI